MPDPKPYPAPGSRTLEEILSDLRQPVPARLIKTKKVPTKKGGSYEADFIPHTTIRDLLDLYAPGWCSHKEIHHAGGKLYVVVRLQVVGSDGVITREGIGNESDDMDGYGDPSSNSDAMGLRRAAMEFGLGRDLWRK